MGKILATITTFNPDIELLEENIESVIGQVDKLILYENNSQNRREVITLCSQKNIEIILNDKNRGVAGPLYDGINYAIANDYSHILTLDQDSVCSEGMVDYLYQKFDMGEKIAVASANPITEKAKDMDSDVFVNNVITSGSLYDVKKIFEIGNYIQEMFIDWVDIEMCYRILENGYKILQCKVPIYHHLGKPIIKKFLNKSFVVANYSKERLYYIWRNSYYCFKRYKTNSELNKYFKKVLFEWKLFILLFESRKLEKFKAIRKGKKDSRTFYKSMREKYNIKTCSSKE